jgi:mono/diheme cytochrome c family protein
MGTRSHLSGIVAGHPGWTALACLATLAACTGRDRTGGRGAAQGQESGAVQTPATPASDVQTMNPPSPQTPAAQPSSTPAESAQSAGSKGTDSDKAGEIARAPRGNPNAPPRPKLTPGESGGGADTNPTQPASKPKPDESSGTTESASPPLHDKYHPAPMDTVSQAVYTGWKYFNLNCARCHGEDVTGTTLAPHLIDSFKSGKVNHDEFWKVVHGSRAQLGMPNWSGVIDDEKLEAIFQYVKGRSDGKLHPGRPAVQGG